MSVDVGVALTVRRLKPFFLCGRQFPTRLHERLSAQSLSRKTVAPQLFPHFLNRCAVTAAPSTDGQVDQGASGGRGTH